AIQDWRDQASRKMYTEADGFLAGALASRRAGQRPFKGLTPYDEAYEAAGPVTAGKVKAAPGDKAWETAYQSVVDAVKKQYPDSDKTDFDRTRGEEPGREKKKLEEPLKKALKAKQITGAVKAVSEVGGTVGALQ